MTWLSSLPTWCEADAGVGGLVPEPVAVFQEAELLANEARANLAQERRAYFLLRHNTDIQIYVLGVPIIQTDRQTDR